MKSINSILVSKILKKKFFKEDVNPSIFNPRRGEESGWVNSIDPGKTPLIEKKPNLNKIPRFSSSVSAKRTLPPSAKVETVEIKEDQDQNII